MSLKRALFGFTFVLGCGGATSPDVHNPGPGPKTAAVNLGPAPESSEARLDWALAGAQRTQQERARDVYRHPKETLGFFGITKDSHVVELWPGGGWYTAILAPFLRDSGKLSVTNFDPATVQGERKEFAVSFENKLGGSPGIYGKVEVRHVNPPTDIVLGQEGSADVVVTFRNFHNWVQAGFEKSVVDAAFKVLKHGGVFGVVEHRGESRRGREDGQGDRLRARADGHRSRAGRGLQARAEEREQCERERRPQDTRAACGRCRLRLRTAPRITTSTRPSARATG